MRKPTTMKGILLAAVRVLEKHGWCQNEFHNDRGHYCMLGALNAAAGVYSNYSTARTVMANNGYDARWNDGPGRTRRQVIAALRRVARGL